MSASLLHRRWTPWAFLVPAFLVLGVFVLASMVSVAQTSFTDASAFSREDPRYIGFENYSRLLASDRFWLGLGNSAFYLLVTPPLIALSMLAATVVDASLRWARGLRLLLFLPVVTPTLVGAIAWSIVLRQDDGILNGALRIIGLGPVPWLTIWPWTLVSAMLVTMWKGFGFYMMIFLAGLIAVPRELKEAASLDGAGRLSVARHVVLPSLWPAITLVFLVSSISALKVFEEIYITVKGVPSSHLTAVPLIYTEAFETGDFGLASAMSVLLFVAVLGLSLINLRLSTRGGDRPSPEKRSVK